jgi:hypothetical protein
MPLELLVAWIVAGVYALLSALHVYWASGGRWAAQAVLPHIDDDRPAFEPSWFATVLVAIALAAAAVLVLCRAGVLPWPFADWLLRPSMYVLGVVFALRAIGDFRVIGFFKRVRGTRFARLDSWIFVPLCTALAIAVLWLA